jgi:hypothetical protein
MKTTHLPLFLVISALAAACSARADVIPADFNSSEWRSFQTEGAGLGVSPSADGSGFTITFPANAGIGGGRFEAGYESNFRIGNEVTVDVDFRLTTWPVGGGVWVGVGFGDSHLHVLSRISLPSFDAYYGRGSFITVPTNDASGTIRIINQGAFAYGSVFNGTEWLNPWYGKAIGYAGDPIIVSAWADDSRFGDAEVVVEFSNLRITGDVIPSSQASAVPEPFPVMDLALLLLLPLGARQCARGCLCN